MVFRILVENFRQALYLHWAHEVLLILRGPCQAIVDLGFLRTREVELEDRDAEIENIEVAQIRLEKTEVSK
jgi:hypothetical protein